MEDVRYKYKKTRSRIGITLLVFALLIEVLMTIYSYISMAMETMSGGVATEVVSSILYDVAYLASFMLPAVVMALLCGKKLQPFRFEPKLSGSTFALIATGIACVFSFSYINSVAASFLPVGGGEDIFFEQYSSDHSLVLQFITIAIVPAFCEEFLFRGVILSNLMPYGKSTAIVISALCFGIMHGNFLQFLYATAAGIVLGAVYVKTDSIWTSTLIHLINNALSILQMAVFDKMSEYAANTVWLMVDCFIFALGIVGAIILVKSYKTSERSYKPVFGQPLNGAYERRDAAMGGHIMIEPMDAIRLFFAPTMIAFIIIRVGYAFLFLFVILYYSVEQVHWSRTAQRAVDC